jgi:peptidoglycan-N-acetylglucosamine deacetylase
MKNTKQRISRILVKIKNRIGFSITNSIVYKKIELNIIGSVTHFEVKENIAALTFDGGPDERWTPELLDILDEYNVKGTFFVIGKYAEKHIDIIRKTAQAGHAIGNHSWDHPSFPLIDRVERIRQIERTSDVLGADESKLFRPPYGHQLRDTLWDVYRSGYLNITWDTHPFDWQDHDPGWITENLLKELHPGAIILLHDAVCDQRNKSRAHMMSSLRQFLKTTQDTYRFVTLPDMMKIGKPIKEMWIRKPNMKHLESYTRVI